MLGKHRFKVGQRVRLSDYGRLRNILLRSRQDARGTVTKVDQFNSPDVLWDHRKTTSGYHPDFIEPVSKRARDAGGA